MNEIRKGIIEKLQNSAKSMMIRYPCIQHDELAEVVIPLCLDEIAEIIEALENSTSTGKHINDIIDKCNNEVLRLKGEMYEI